MGALGGMDLTAIPTFMLLMSASMKFAQKPEVIEGFTGKFGYPQGALLVLGAVEAACAVIYLIPQTAVLGAILVTGYLGGATATHVRVGDPFFAPVVLGILAWGGLYLRDPKLRAFLPLRSK